MDGNKWKKGLLYTAACILMVLADQLTKWLITVFIPYGGDIRIIPDFFDISHVLNTGAAWGILNQHTVLLSVVTLIACLLIVYLLIVSVNAWLTSALLMILSGAVGNLIDRIFRGEVVDFLSFHFGSYDFPSFNVADICITCGCILLLIIVIFVAKDGNTLFCEGSLARRWFGSVEKQAVQGEEDHASEL